jgi:HK97 family phage portal protein
MLKYMPQSNYSSFDFWHLMEFNAIMRGAGGAEIIRDGNGRAVSLRIFRTGATWHQPWNTDRPLIYDNETGKAFDISDVVYLPGLTVSDGIKNYTLMNLFRDTFGEDIAGRLLRYNFNKQGPHLGGVYTYTGTARDIQKLKQADDLIKDFGGAENAGKILPISQAENFKQFSPISLADAQTVDLAKLRIEDASRITGVPLSLLASIDKTSYNSMSELFQQWKITELDPRFTQLDEELNRKLLATRELGQHYIETVIDELMWSTPKERAEYWRELIKSGLMLPNEGREYLNRPKVEGGDTALIEANNLQPLKLVAEGAALKNNPSDKNGNERKNTPKSSPSNGVAIHAN